MAALLRRLLHSLSYFLDAKEPHAPLRFSDGSAIPEDGQRHADPRDPGNTFSIFRTATSTDLKDGQYIAGSVAFIKLLDDTTILKVAHDDLPYRVRAMSTEQGVLIHLGKHNRIVEYLGHDGRGTCLRRAELGNLKSFMEKTSPLALTNELRMKWFCQLTEAVIHVHGKGVIHCDIKPENLLVKKNWELVLSDFSGSYYEAGQMDGRGLESTRYCLPRDFKQPSTVASDLFALGSTLYFIATGSDPYPAAEYNEDDVRAYYESGQFPATETLPAGVLISGCWNGTIKTAAELYSQLRNALQELLPPVL